MIHALTIDVEDYYSILSRDWLGADRPPTDAVVRNTERMLELVGGYGVKATCFVLGEVAAAFPQLVRRIADAGHELGVHGYSHRQVFKLSREEFGREAAEAKKLVEDAGGQRAEGYRAAAFSIGPETRWALEVLAHAGFRYDSSVFPIAGKRYGWPGFPLDIHEMALPGGQTIIEAPMSVVTVLGKVLPACGGGYIRHLPYWYTRWAIRRIGRVRPAIVYLHPYELDMDAPPPEMESALAAAEKPARKFHRLQLRNRQTVHRKVTRLLESFQFAPLRDVIDAALPPR